MNLADEYGTYVEAQVSEYLTASSAYAQTPPAITTGLYELTEQRKVLVQMLQQIQSAQPQPLTIDVASLVRKKYDTIARQAEQQRQQIKSEFEQKKSAALATVAQHNAEITQYNSSLTVNMDEKKQTLLQYEPKLQSYFRRYGIDESSVTIGDVTPDEFNTLLDAAIQTAQELTEPTDNPIVKAIRSYKAESPVYAMSIIIACALLAFFIAPLLAVYGFYILYKEIKGASDTIDKLKIAASLLAETDYNRYIPQDAYKEKEQDPDFTEAASEMEKQLSEVSDGHKQMEEELQLLSAYEATVRATCESATDKLHKAYDECVQRWQDAVKACDDAIEKARAEYHKFPEYCQTCCAMNNAFTLGYDNDEINATYDIPMTNLVFKAKNLKDRAILPTLKLYLCNAILSTRPKNIEVVIFDPTYQGSEFAEFLSAKDAVKYIHLDTKSGDYNTFIHSCDEKLRDNIAALNNEDIDTYNKRAQENDLTPMPYTLLVIASGLVSDESKDKGLDDDEKKVLDEFLKFTRKSGLIVWLIDSQTHDGCTTVTAEYPINHGTPIAYDFTFGSRTMNTYLDALANYKDTGVSYEGMFREKFIPWDKVWTWNTIKGIELNFGLMDGNPTKGLPLTLGDANVHALMGGETGAGKSAAINQMLVSLCLKYPPSELHITYVDFKNVEATKFTKGIHRDGSWMTQDEVSAMKERKEYFKRISYIPQFNIIAGTKDGGYARSLFKYFLDEMDRRNAVLAQHGEVKLEDLRKHILRKYNAEHNTPKGTWADMRKDWDWYKPNILDKGLEIPRYLIIVDEFQVMYNDQIVDVKTQGVINGLITAIAKLARAMGCHFWFTSQSMNNTISEDTKSNFTVRAALRCSAEISESLIGNKASGTITQKFGYMYTNDSGGKDPNANRLWRIPYLDAEDINPMYIDKLWPLLEPNHEVPCNAEFFDDTTHPPLWVLQEWYENHPELFMNPMNFIVGERAEYSANRAPVTFVLSREAGENVIIGGFELRDVVNNTLTILENIKMKGIVDVIINVQDMNAYKLIGPERYVPENLQSLCSPETLAIELYNKLFEIFKARKQKDPADCKTLFIVLPMWEVADKVVASANYDTQDNFAAMLRDAPKWGMHFIISAKGKGELTRAMIGACNHRICSAMSSDDSMFFAGDNGSILVERLPQGNSGPNLGICEYGSEDNKFKIYHHEFAQELGSREVVL